MHRQNRKRQKMAKVRNRYNPPRICIDSLPTNCGFLTPIMSRSNVSCSSCMCNQHDEDEAPCCNSAKCELNIQKEQHTQTVISCKPEEPVDLDINCPICRAEKTKQSKAEQFPCKECSAKAKSADGACPLCKSPKTNNIAKNEAKKVKDSASNTCPTCKDSKSTVKVEKELRCPSCAQPVAIQCCGPGSAHSLSIMIIPEKLLKTISTNTKGDNPSCCQIKKEPATPKSKEGCGMESCMATKNAKSAEDQKKDPVGKGEKAAECSDVCPPAGNECSCVFPPAYKQYTCTGQISGTCDCTKKE